MPPDSYKNLFLLWVNKIRDIATQSLNRCCCSSLHCAPSSNRFSGRVSMCLHCWHKQAYYAGTTPPACVMNYESVRRWDVTSRSSGIVTSTTDIVTRMVTSSMMSLTTQTSTPIAALMTLYVSIGSQLCGTYNCFFPHFVQLALNVELYAKIWPLVKPYNLVVRRTWLKKRVSSLFER